MRGRRLGAALVAGVVLVGCQATSRLSGPSVVPSLKAGQPDALVLPEPSGALTRLEPSSRVRFEVRGRGLTEWVLAEQLHASENALWWRTTSGRAVVLREMVDAVEVVTFSRWRAMLAALLTGITGGAFAALPIESAPSVEPDPGPQPGDGTTLERLFSPVAMRRDKVRFIVSQEFTYGLSSGTDLALVSHVGVRLFDFFEMTAGLRLAAADIFGKTLPPLTASSVDFVPGFSARALFVGLIDPWHRFAVLVGLEGGLDSRALGFIRPLWGLRGRPVGDLHVSALLATPTFDSRGVSWGFGLDVGWHF